MEKSRDGGETQEQSRAKQERERERGEGEGRGGGGANGKSLQSEQGVFRPLGLPASRAAAAGADGGAGLSAGDAG